MHRKMGRHRVETTLGEGRESAKGNHIKHPMVEGDSLSRSRHEPEYNVLNKVVIKKATYA